MIRHLPLCGNRDVHEIPKNLGSELRRFKVDQADFLTSKSAGASLARIEKKRSVESTGRGSNDKRAIRPDEQNPNGRVTGPGAPSSEGMQDIEHNDPSSSNGLREPNSIA
ncbi:MAG: hypothetical protein JOZ66_03045 [Hyphomicrobiales bacterium]|nr:hypothetical protein [Hyphomicrobiales bacterium]